MLETVSLQKSHDAVGVFPSGPGRDHSGALINSEQKCLCLLDPFPLLFELRELQVNNIKRDIRMLCGYYVRGLLELNFVRVAEMSRLYVTSNIIFHAWPLKSFHQLVVRAPESVMSS